MYTFEEIEQIRISSEATDFQTFKGIHYVIFDIMANFGWDKENFETRLHRFKQCSVDWWQAHLHRAEEPVLALKALNAYRDAMSGKPTGYMANMDAVCSGVQILSCVTGCYEGATQTGLVDPSVRKDAYGAATGYMNDILATDGIEVDVPRKAMKDALMPYFYGSSAEPKKLFGEKTQELEVFYQVCHKMFEGASAARDLAIDIWQPYQERHTWKLPDGHTASPVNIVKEKVTIKIAELAGAQFTHIVNEVKGEKRAVSLAGNITHSIDGFIVREMNRRCNYNKDYLIKAIENIEYVLCDRDVDYLHMMTDENKFLATNYALNYASVAEDTNTDLLIRAYRRLKTMLEHHSFEVVMIHDCFYAAPNNMNVVRYWYKEILAELADSDIFQHIVRQITGNNAIQITKLSNDLSKYIRKSNYGLA